VTSSLQTSVRKNETRVLERAFVYPIAFLFSADRQVLTVGTVTSLIKADVYKWGMLMAGALAWSGSSIMC
jgi:hypothetical protein